MASKLLTEFTQPGQAGRREAGGARAPAHRPRARGAQARGPGHEQPGDRRRALHLREHGEEPRPEHPREAAPALPDGGGRLRRPREAPRHPTSGPERRPDRRTLGRRMGVFDKILRAGEGKKLKALQALVPDITALEPEMEALSDDALQAKTGRVPRAPRQRRGPRRPPDRGVRRRPRGRPAGARPAPLRRAAHGRRRAALRLDRRDEDRRGQDPRVHAARLPQRPRRQGHAPHHGERLPGPPRRRVDGPAPPLARPRGRPHRARRERPRPQARAVRRRHHLRHQQRVRLRLPPRQHGHVARRARRSGATATPSSTRSTRSSSTRPARR